MYRHFSCGHRSRNWPSRSTTAQCSSPTSYRSRWTIASPTAVGCDPYTSGTWLSTHIGPGCVDWHLGGLILELGRVSSALAPAPRFGRALTNAPSLPDIMNIGTVRLGCTSVVLPPLQAPHCPLDHLIALKVHRSSPEHPTMTGEGG
jgi:hypothetical protein